MLDTTKQRIVFDGPLACWTRWAVGNATRTLHINNFLLTLSVQRFLRSPVKTFSIVLQ